MRARDRLPWFVGLGLLALLAAALVGDRLRAPDRPPDLPDEGCVHCHQPVSISRSHPEEFGCSSCHLGDPRWLDERRGHRGMVARPSELAVAARTCGQADCHPDQVERVQAGLMATNAGITAVLAYQFGEAHDPDGGGAPVLAGGIPALAAQPPGTELTLAEDHARKFCATCHLHKPLGDLPGEIGTRGGGCADCHLSPAPDAATLPPRGEPGWAGDGGPASHPRLTTRIPTDECAKCHNRSARIALSYRGEFEDEGYATPYVRGGPTTRELSGGRSAQPLLPDVHHESGMACIDCHLGAGVMGDGEVHVHMEDQVAVACEDCHRPRWSEPLQDGAIEGTVDHDALRAARLNGGWPLASGDQVALGRRDDPLPHVVPGDEGPVLIGRMDGETRDIPELGDEAHHTLPGHERMACQACHSAWTPQCYGCHEVYDRAGTQRDHLAGRDTPGRWEERRSYLRFERPTLGIGPGGTVQPFAPGCQVFMTELNPDAEGAPRVDPERFPALAMGAFDPHATRTAVPTCLQCHVDPKVLGLGDGTLVAWPDGLAVASAWDPARSGLDIEHPLDAFVAADGTPLQTTSRVDSRPFDGEELGRILGVAPCLPCHDTYDDPVYADWARSVTRWRGDRSLPCPGPSPQDPDPTLAARAPLASSPPTAEEAPPTSPTDADSRACLACHERISAPGAGHDVACMTCHGVPGRTARNLPGDHGVVVANPSAPASWSAACGPCHADAIARMERSLHVTQAGVINHTRYLLGAQDRVSPPVTTLPELVARDGLDPAVTPAGDAAALADDLLRRRCLRCHLYQPGDGPADLQRGAGCAACHGGRGELGGALHTLARPTSSAPCLRCHHGDHTGADFVGLTPADDHADYRVPLADGEERGDRYGQDQHRLVPDLHHEAGLICSDCHGTDEVMGRPDGPAPAFAAEAVQVRCASCHGGLDGLPTGAPPDGLAVIDGTTTLTLRASGARRAVPAANGSDHPGHEPSGHRRLSCSACHAAWAGQAFGTHLHRSLVGATWNLWDRRDHQGDPEFARRAAAALALAEEARADHAPTMRDRLTGVDVAGIWGIGRTFRRWEEPALGITPDGRVAPLRPRSGFVLTSVGADGLVWIDSAVPTRGDGSGPGQASETFTPHTVRREAAACTRCHGNPRAAGLGIAATEADGALHPDTVPDPPALPGSRLLTDAERQRLLHPDADQRAAIARALLRMGMVR